MNFYRDTDGNVWEPFLNKLQQRQLRCIAGERLGEVIHDPRLGPPPEQQRPAEREENEAWYAAMRKSEFFD